MSDKNATATLACWWQLHAFDCLSANICLPLWELERDQTENRLTITTTYCNNKFQIKFISCDCSYAQKLAITHRKNNDHINPETRKTAHQSKMKPARTIHDWKQRIWIVFEYAHFMFSNTIRGISAWIWLLSLISVSYMLKMLSFVNLTLTERCRKKSWSFNIASRATVNSTSKGATQCMQDMLLTTLVYTGKQVCNMKRFN